LAVFLTLLGCRVGDGDSKVSDARIKVKMLTRCCEEFEVINGAWPPSLDALAAPQPKGGAAFVFPDYLIGPWGEPYHYDPAGPRNNGKRPDIRG
jgi:hypothetical protein